MNDDVISRIRNKVDIVDIVGERIPLVKKGKNYFCVCPFHDDTNPSMCVSREKQIYTCFTCKASGNVYNFLMDYDKMTFKEALHYLGDKVGIKTGSINIKKKDTKYDKYYQIYDLSKKYYRNNLSSTKGKAAKKYLKERLIDDNIINEFEIGLSIDSYDNLTKLLTKKEATASDLNIIGLSSDTHDIYRNRIMFPLYDTNGNTVGFSGRVYKIGDNNNKYLNTKETPIFKKGECLYNYHKAREAARREKGIIVMEGFMDVIRAYTIGIKNVVALMGTALTENQINLLKRLSNNIIICLDGDNAGKKAALSVGNSLNKVGIEAKVVTIPNNDDPDSFITKEGEKKFKILLENAVKFNDYKINIMKENLNTNSVEDVSNYINSVLKEISGIDDEIRREIILKRLEKEYNIGYNTLVRRFLAFKKANINKEKKIITPKKEIRKKDKYRKAMEQIVYFMLTNEWVITTVAKEKLLIPDEDIRILVKEIIYYYEQNGEIHLADFLTYINDKRDLKKSLDEILASNYSGEVDKESLYLYFKVVREFSTKKQIKILEKKLIEELDPVAQAKILSEIAKLRRGE